MSGRSPDAATQRRGYRKTETALATPPDVKDAAEALLVETAIFNFWSPGFYSKRLEDCALAQDQTTESIPNTTPYHWGGGGPGWGGINR